MPSNTAALVFIASSLLLVALRLKGRAKVGVLLPVVAVWLWSLLALLGVEGLGL